jgi:hypothetical protein
MTAGTVVRHRDLSAATMEQLPGGASVLVPDSALTISSSEATFAAFDDNEYYILTHLGAKFVHYVMALNPILGDFYSKIPKRP